MVNEFNNTVNDMLETIVAKPDTKTILISLATSLLLAAIMWLAYRFSNNKSTYKPKFATTLIALAFLSTVLMDLIQSNLALSLGMLGSLSIVRFRTNIKDPRDIGFIFWSMAIGLAASTKCYLIGFVGSLILALFMILTRKRSNTPDDMMLVIRGSNTDISNINTIVDNSCIQNSVKAKNVLSDSYELVYEVKIPINESDNLLKKIFDLGGVDSINLLADNKAM